MLDIYTVSFFGHREISNDYALEEKIEKLVKTLLNEKEYVDFLVGRHGEFDILVSSVIKRVRKNYRSDNSSLTLYLPYESAEYRNGKEYFTEYFDSIEIFDGFHFKSAIYECNKIMVDKSDLSVFFIERETGGAYKVYSYAMKNNRNVVVL